MGVGEAAQNLADGRGKAAHIQQFRCEEAGDRAPLRTADGGPAGYQHRVSTLSRRSPWVSASQAGGPCRRARGPGPGAARLGMQSAGSPGRADIVDSSDKPGANEKLGAGPAGPAAGPGTRRLGIRMRGPAAAARTARGSRRRRPRRVIAARPARRRSRLGSKPLRVAPSVWNHCQYSCLVQSEPIRAGRRRPRRLRAGARSCWTGLPLYDSRGRGTPSHRLGRINDAPPPVPIGNRCGMGARPEELNRLASY